MNQQFSEHNRTFSNIVITPEGAFHSTGDELVDLPEDLQGGAVIELDVVHEVQMVNSAGEVMTLHFDAPKAMVANRSETSYANKQQKFSNIDGGNEMKTGVFTTDHKSKGQGAIDLFGVGP